MHPNILTFALSATCLLLLTITIALLLRMRGKTVAQGSKHSGDTTHLQETFSLHAREMRADAAETRKELALALAEQNERGQQQLEKQRQLRETIEQRFEHLRELNDKKLEQIQLQVGEKLQGTLQTALEQNAARIKELNEMNGARLTEVSKTLQDQLGRLREENEAKLEKMRATVEEKLQSSLERRLGESFKLVSDRLEQVQKGLGEMRTLADDVGGLKRVLTNVKNRGGWGEVQLARQLEDTLTREQYETNIEIVPGSGQRVEFAIKMPGRGDEPAYLPIDSKFPQEDYERLLEAYENANKEQIDSSLKALEKALRTQAKTIGSKYINVPRTTDFAIMYLPTEGLFAEAVRLPGLKDSLQTEHRVVITGPSTLLAVLNSLQMGFRTLAIEKRSSEVWQVLAAAKREFDKYSEVWEKLEKQLQTVQNTVQDAGVRSRAVSRNLKAIETSETLPKP